MNNAIKEKQPVSASASNLTLEKLKWNRVQIYKTHVTGGVPSVFLRINGRFLTPAIVDNRSKNFRIFVKMYLYSGVDGSTDPMSNRDPHLPIKLKPSSKGYKALERYAKTDYGSAVIKEMISNSKKYPKFEIQQVKFGGARADYRVIFLPPNFPSKLRFPIGGQKIFDLAIIHHEFTHTMLVRSKTAKKLISRMKC